MKPDDFEKILQQQPPRAVPPEWRAEILRAANAARAESTDRGRLSSLEIFRRRWVALLWPAPRAWAGLAAVWVGIVAVNFWSTDTAHPSPTLASAVAPSRELLQVVREQHRELARLLESPAPETADEPKIFSPRPRSEARREFPLV